MTFHVVHRSDLPASQSPVRLTDEQGREIEWANRFLDAQRMRALQPLSLQSYAYALLHFLRWWAAQPGVDVGRFTCEQFTESTLVDYVRDQLNEQPRLRRKTSTTVPLWCGVCSASTFSKTCPMRLTACSAPGTAARHSDTGGRARRLPISG